MGIDGDWKADFRNTFCFRIQNKMAFKALCSSLLVVIFAFNNVGATSCPDGWQSHKGACYHYMKESFSWFDALQVCNDQGGYLAEPTAQDQLVFLQGMIMDHAGERGVAWIGMEDFAEEGLFLWTRTKQEVQNFFWKKGEPNDDRLEGDCVGIDRFGQFDQNCEDAKYSFICQIPPTEAVVVGK